MGSRQYLHNSLIRCVMYLDWGWLQGKYFVPSSFGVAVHVDQDVYLVCIDAVCGLSVIRNLEGVGRGEGGREEGREGGRKGERKGEREGGRSEGGREDRRIGCVNQINSIPNTQHYCVY